MFVSAFPVHEIRVSTSTRIVVVDSYAALIVDPAETYDCYNVTTAGLH